MYCENCNHAVTYHALAATGDKIGCASRGCDCPGWEERPKEEAKPEDKPKWNT